MILSVDVHLQYRFSQPTDLLLQIEAADLADQTVRQTHISFSEVENVSRITADDGLGERIWLRARVSDLLCMSNSVHASLTKEHEDNDDYEGSIRRAAERG